VLGVTRATGLTLASFGGGSAAGGSCLGGTYALANHEAAPDAAHPVFFSLTNLQSVAAQVRSAPSASAAPTRPALLPPPDHRLGACSPALGRIGTGMAATRRRPAAVNAS
jgi:hypothetical protein